MTKNAKNIFTVITVLAGVLFLLSAMNFGLAQLVAFGFMVNVLLAIVCFQAAALAQKI